MCYSVPGGTYRVVRTAVRSAVVLVAVAFLALPAAAQITTGTVFGTVKDAQGAVIPGAAVTLVNVPADRYTLQVSMTGFKTSKRSGVAVSPGDRLSLGSIAIEVGGLTDTVVVKAESPVVQSNS